MCVGVFCQRELRLLGLLPITGEIYPGGLSCLVPVKMAVDKINAHSDLLQGYTLTYEYIDNEVSSFFGVGKNLFKY